MKIYSICYDYLSQFIPVYAEAVRIASYDKINNYKPILPTIIEWELNINNKGSDLIGDFTDLGGGGTILVKYDVGKELQAKFNDFDLVPVQMYQRPSLKRPTRPNKRSQKRVWLPYEGPELREIWDAKIVKPAIVKDNYLPNETGKIVGYRKQFYSSESDLEVVKQTNPLEWYCWIWDEVLKDEIAIKLPREKGYGYFIKEKDLKKINIFRIRESGGLYCTERVVEFVTSKGYTNIEFFEEGETI